MSRIEVLKLLTVKLEPIDWALIGSTNLAIQGVDIKANDIDIITNAKGAILAEIALKEFEIKPVEYSESPHFKSYFGIFEIQGIKVEIMGDLQKRHGDSWTEPSRLDGKKMIEYNGVKLPIIPLEQEYEAYLRLGRLDRADLIRQALDKK